MGRPASKRADSIHEISLSTLLQAEMFKRAKYAIHHFEAHNSRILGADIADFEDGPMYFKYSRTAGTLMKAIDILRDHNDRLAFLLKIGDCQMGCVRLRQ